SCYNWGIFSKTKHADVCEDLIRWLEDEKNFAEYVSVSVGQAGPVYKGRADHPYWESGPNFAALPPNILRSATTRYPRRTTPAAVALQAQHILTDRAGRVVTGGPSPEAALKEAHARVEEIYKVRRS